MEFAEHFDPTSFPVACSTCACETTHLLLHPSLTLHPNPVHTHTVALFDCLILLLWLLLMLMSLALLLFFYFLMRLPFRGGAFYIHNKVKCIIFYPLTFNTHAKKSRAYARYGTQSRMRRITHTFNSQHHHQRNIMPE